MQAHSKHARECSWSDNWSLCICWPRDLCANRQSNNHHVCAPARGNLNGPHETNQMHRPRTPVVEGNRTKLKLEMDQWGVLFVGKANRKLNNKTYNFIRWFWWFSITELDDLLCGGQKLAASSPRRSCRMILTQIWWTFGPICSQFRFQII